MAHEAIERLLEAVSECLSDLLSQIDTDSPRVTVGTVSEVLEHLARRDLAGEGAERTTFAEIAAAATVTGPTARGAVLSLVELGFITAESVQKAGTLVTVEWDAMARAVSDDSDVSANRQDEILADLEVAGWPIAPEDGGEA